MLLLLLLQALPSPLAMSMRGLAHCQGASFRWATGALAEKRLTRQLRNTVNLLRGNWIGRSTSLAGTNLATEMVAVTQGRLECSRRALVRKRRRVSVCRGCWRSCS